MPPVENNPLIKLLMDVSASQESLLEDHLLLTNRFNIHRSSDYCLTLKSGKNKKCRMEFGSKLSLNKSTIAPVGWLPLQAYHDTYFSVAMISLTEGFSGGLLEIKSHFPKY
jgi:hypothetical protein